MSNFNLENDSNYNEFADSINEVLIGKILTEFRNQDALVRKHTKTSLSVPNFEISYATSRWGQWDEENNTLSLSVHLFRKFSWSAVVKVLKHEMAHMIVSEIFIKKDGLCDSGKHHGELFKKACAILDLEYSRCDSCTSLEEYEVPKREKIVSKVKKLMALGNDENGGSQEETKSALKMAHKLMIQYNIDSIETERSDNDFLVRPVGKRWKKVPTYIKILSNTVSEYYFVKHIYCGSKHFGRYIEFFGEPQNLDIAEYVFHFLLNEGERQWKDFQKSDQFKNRHEITTKLDHDDKYIWSDADYDYIPRKRKKAVYSKGAFLEGLYRGFEEHLEANERAIAESIAPDDIDSSEKGDYTNNLPIGINDPLLDEKFREQYNPKSWHSSAGSSGGGHGEGMDRGRNVRVRHGVNSGGGSSTKMLN